MYMDKYNAWINSPYVDDETKNELKSISEKPEEIEDRFYKDLEFGTAGMRGVIGAGTNRMNNYTVGLTTQALANYIVKRSQRGRDMGVVIAYDSRKMSREFAKRAALILCANGIKTYFFESIRPVPVLSYAIRNLGCISGIVITASHNPPEYNGYKVYWKQGYQLTPVQAGEISNELNKIYDFKNINLIEEDEAVSKGLLKYISFEVDEGYYRAVISQCVDAELISKRGQDLKIVYSPLHGSGNIPVRTVLKEAGFENVFVVREQEKPDGTFPTVKVPNPEDVDVFKLPVKLAEEKDADIIIATDPDADRLGVAFKERDGRYVNLTGNQIGVLVEYYLLKQMKSRGELPENGVIIKSIVTTDLADAIAEGFGVKVENTLTGFKYIGEKIEEYSNTKLKKFILGFEESYGYLVGDHVRDKDAVVTSLIVSEMALHFKSCNKTLGEVLNEIYARHGYWVDEIESIKLGGKEGKMKIHKISSFFRKELPMTWSGHKVSYIEDYMQGKRNIIGEGVDEMTLPSSNVLKIYLEDKSWFCIRPSGTEPKIKFYFSVRGDSPYVAKDKLAKIKSEVMEIALKAAK